jgi:hypothetical protein
MIFRLTPRCKWSLRSSGMLRRLGIYRHYNVDSYLCLILEDETDRLSRNVGKYLPIYTSWHSRRANISTAKYFSNRRFRIEWPLFLVTYESLKWCIVFVVVSSSLLLLMLLKKKSSNRTNNFQRRSLTQATSKVCGAAGPLTCRHTETDAFSEFILCHSGKRPT